MYIFTNSISPELLTLGPLSIRWYGLFFAIGLLLNYLYTQWIFKREKLDLKDLESVATYLFFGMLIGARLGHVFFYEAEYYLNHPGDIIKIWNGGLASHGAAIGVLIAYLLWIKIHKKSFTRFADLLILGMPITASFVRIGNFFNSEIIGIPTDGTWGVIFAKLGETFPRHPSQIYEALINFSIFIILFLIYKNIYHKKPALFMLFIYVFLYFTTRFFVEFWKQRYILLDGPFSMGQILSILPVTIATIYFLFSYPRHIKDPTNNS